ncbi:hypothetical protein [Methanobacterium sp.]|uniref:hypothetical protein n=1 Tax=Methanobacterium sp. TaxID=2164 RepID=UPI003C75DB8C
MKKILYVMHIDWRWIKQRSHFLAEDLSNFYDINVVYFCSKKFLLENSSSSTINKKNLTLLPAFRLPLYEKKGIYGLNKAYLKLYFKLLIEKYNPDFIWITFPQIYDYIPSNTHCKIIYDCMDEATGFDFQKDLHSKILEVEKKLVNDASIIFASSNYLCKNLDKNYGCKDKLAVIRNAFNGEIIDNQAKDSKKHESFKIGYVGTIADLIDFDKIKITLHEIKNIEYHFIGPYVRKDKLRHDRIKFYGTISHEKLYDYVKNFDCLIMPFKLNELVKSVDPVKLYEYINYNKPIISVYYEELDYFSQFISFYSNTGELISLLKQMIKNNFVTKYSYSERAKFLETNSWNIRVAEITKYLAKL